MKLFVPIVGMMVASGACCCCGGGDMAEQIEALSREATENATSTPITTEGDAEEPAAEPAAEPASGGSGLGSSTAGLCGRFKDDGMTLPDGFSVIACTTSGTTEALLLQGSGSPKDTCAAEKAWATGAGWSVTTEASMMDTSSILLAKDSNRMTLACTNATGNTTVSVSISPG
jgi:hypothetical protein